MTNLVFIYTYIYPTIPLQQDSHMLEGMAMLLDEAPELRPSIPNGFPTCGDWHIEESTPTMTTAAPKSDIIGSTQSSSTSKDEQDGVLITGNSCILLVLFFLHA